MKKAIMIFVAFFLYLQNAKAENDSSPIKDRKFSIEGWLSIMPFPVSESMRGTENEFRQELEKDYTNSKYPFSMDSSFLSLGWGGKIMYSLTDNADIYVGLSGNYFGKMNSTARNRVSMLVIGTQIGAEYNFFPRTETINLFARGGINVNLIGGLVQYDYFFGLHQTDVPFSIRLGFDIEPGLRFLIPSTPIALELSGNYYHANLIGKSYTRPAVQPVSPLSERGLNDGTNPDNPNDVSRTIDFFQIKLGARIWF